MTSLAIRPLNPSLQAIAKDQLFEETDKIQENLDAFKEWIRKSPHLKPRTDDQFLVTFLRGCKYSLERAKQKIDNFYTMRAHIPEMMEGRDPLDKKNLAIIKLGSALPLPFTETPGSPRLMLMRFGISNPELHKMTEIMKVNGLINDIMMLEDDNLAIAGQIGVIDLTGVTMGHFIQMQPSLMKKMTMMMQDAIPIRQKGIHYINAPKSFEQIFNWFKSFLNAKMQSRLYVHSTLESFYKVVPRRLMPTEYEGEAGSLQSINEAWEKKILSYRNYFLEDSKYGVDEKLRPGKPKSAESLFGLEGTFRQLAFD